ncbi:hypothetical protein FH972_006644 [Carpinus fangiana]|uniref:Bidirectional sugar transporter SWEET n=1 Tax=Carpinus fangiana TaxID=176857 RepID=A0A5N6QW59_9ROSI|nr:hypothetical protein FH972_006644 [Carpinus fangiana]
MAAALSFIIGIIVNGTGVVFQFIYVTLFLIYAPNLLKVKTAKLVGILNVGFLGLVIAVSLVALHGSVRLTFVGILCAALTVGMYASPLSAMRLVIKTKSVEYMPFFLSFFLFLNAGIWSAYAVLVQDFFVGVPNGVGVLLGSAQLILYAVYKNKSNIMSTKSTEKMEEESPAHLVKGIIQMQAFHEDDEEALKNRSLDKGRSLPKPPVNREKTFLRAVKKKSTENYKSVPYITTLLSTSLWTFYGLLKPGGLLVWTVNGAGVVFQFIYVTLFLIYSPTDKKVKTAKLVGILNVGFFGLVIAVTLLALHGSVRLTFVGILCAALTVGMYASPLSAMLILYAVYKNKSNIISTKSTEKMEEESSAHLVKGIVQMQAFHEDDEEALKNLSLNKGRSLPKSPVNRQYSFQNILKTFSLNPYGDDIEKGEKNLF